MKGFVAKSVFVAVCAMAGQAIAADDLAGRFARPPDSAKPWVYWFWLNGNITDKGIVADLEAMKRVGIGGVLIMETDQGAPLGPVPFASPEWRRLFKLVVQTSNRLGLEVNMNDDAGWCGSGGPWIKPEQSMQKVVWSEAQVDGGRRVTLDLPQPETVAGFYKDVAVIAFPSVGSYRIPDIRGRAGYVRQDGLSPLDPATVPRDSVIEQRRVIDLSKMALPGGRVSWDAPAGNWTVMRIGHTSTGRVNLPAPKSGEGLECDKLSKEGARAAFDGFMKKLIQDVGPLAGKTLVRTHIDSWEIGSQNWTARFREEFRRLRGYDLLPFLPAFSGRVVGSPEITDRFLWDLRQTISDLTLENYAGEMQRLARRNGIQLSIEAYGDTVVDDLAYAGRADEPMSEFWTWGGGMRDPESHFEPYIFEMASAAHVYGKRILGAEAFTSNDSERWLYHPGSIKGLGDWQFAHGVNRFVFHRYALQPWLNAAPGMSMGPWGLHYERTQTWWDQSTPWHEYLARCQYLLQQGTPVADVLYLAPEGAPSNFIPPVSAIRGAYRADACPPEALLTRATVKNGQISFPGGPSYRVLVLPSTVRMTPAMLRKIRSMVDQGATVVGSKPTRSPSLSGYPACDQEVRRLADDLWSSGRVSTRTPEQALQSMRVPPDFEADRLISAGHRRVGSTDVYFVANTRKQVTNAICRFRVSGMQPELWDPETGAIEPAASFRVVNGVTEIPFSFGPSDSIFVVFRSPIHADPVARFTVDGKEVMDTSPARMPKIVVKRAVWGPIGDEKRTKDVTAQVQRIVDTHVSEFRVADLAIEGDPAYLVVKTLRMDYEIDGKPMTARATDPEVVTFPIPADAAPLARVEALPDGRVMLRAWGVGEFEARTSAGKTRRASVPALPEHEVKGPWTLNFGKPTMPSGPIDWLMPWNESDITDVRYFSGSGTYRKTIDVPSSLFGEGLRQVLDLGRVEVIAEVRLNGKELGVLWRTPHTVDVTGILQPGRNELEVKVTNLWPNRMIGDELLPEDSERNPNGTLKRWPDWVLQERPSPTGRQTFTSWRLWKKDDKPLPSGLLGPVRIRTEAWREMR